MTCKGQRLVVPAEGCLDPRRWPVGATKPAMPECWISSGFTGVQETGKGPSPECVQFLSERELPQSREAGLLCFSCLAHAR